MFRIMGNNWSLCSKNDFFREGFFFGDFDIVVVLYFRFGEFFVFVFNEYGGCFFVWDFLIVRWCFDGLVYFELEKS